MLSVTATWLSCRQNTEIMWVLMPFALAKMNISLVVFKIMLCTVW